MQLIGAAVEIVQRRQKKIYVEIFCCAVHQLSRANRSTLLRLVSGDWSL